LVVQLPELLEELVILLILPMVLLLEEQVEEEVMATIPQAHQGQAEPEELQVGAAEAAVVMLPQTLLVLVVKELVELFT
jgi:hypothetical protein